MLYVGSIFLTILPVDIWVASIPRLMSVNTVVHKASSCDLPAYCILWLSAEKWTSYNSLRNCYRVVLVRVGWLVLFFSTWHKLDLVGRRISIEKTEYLYPVVCRQFLEEWSVWRGPAYGAVQFPADGSGLYEKAVKGASLFPQLQFLPPLFLPWLPSVGCDLGFCKPDKPCPPHVAFWSWCFIKAIERKLRKRFS